MDHAKSQYYYLRSSYMGIPLYEVTHNHMHRFGRYSTARARDVQPPSAGHMGCDSCRVDAVSVL